jgi:hypothetical protein
MGDPERIKKLNSLLDQIKGLNKKRNDIVHSSLEILGKRQMFRQKTTAKFERGYKLEIQFLTPDELTEHVHTVKTTIRELNASLANYRKYKEQQTEG